MRSWSLACAGSRMGLDQVKASRAEFPAQLGHRPLVGIEHRVIELLDRRALEEAEEEAAARTKDASELGEGNVDGPRLVMDE